MAQPDHPTGFFTKPTVSVVGLRPLSASSAPHAAGAAGTSGSFYPDAPAVKRHLSNILTAIFLAVALVGSVQIGSLVWPEQQWSSTTSSASQSAAAPPAKPVAAGLARSAPTTLNISAIGVNAPVVAVGLDNNGSVEVPGPNDVGWYQLGPSPGEVGPAVMVGHVDDAVIGPAVFWNLRNMQPGQTIQIARGDGRTISFIVEKVGTYDQNNFPTDEVYGNLDYAGLRLITCEGDFDYVTHHYSDNLVVFARAQQ